MLLNRFCYTTDTLKGLLFSCVLKLELRYPLSSYNKLHRWHIKTMGSASACVLCLLGWRLIIRLGQGQDPSLIHSAWVHLWKPVQLVELQEELYSGQVRAKSLITFRLIYSDRSCLIHSLTNLKTMDKKGRMDFKNIHFPSPFVSCGPLCFKVKLTLLFMAKQACIVFKFMSYQSSIHQKVLGLIRN